jgi:hypothetical protein
VFEGEVTSITFLGESSEVSVKVGPTALTAKLHGSAAFRRGQRLWAEIAPADCILLNG